ncbi:MAG: hypothetical protein ABH819_03495 [Patescibacteria group bacterium]
MKRENNQITENERFKQFENVVTDLNYNPFVLLINLLENTITTPELRENNEYAMDDNNGGRIYF